MTRALAMATAIGTIAAILLAPGVAAATPQLLGSWGGSGSGPGQFDEPFGIATGPDGSVYVADTENHRVQQFTAAGEFVRQWGSNGAGNGEFDRPTGVETDATGDVFVVEIGGMRVQRFSAGGAYEAKWGSFGSGPGEFSFPIDLAVDAAGDVYVPDFVDRVQKFDRDGGFIAEWGSSGGGPGELDDPSGVAATADGVYVADTGNHRVQRFTPLGSPAGPLGSLAPGDFTSPFGIDAGPAGELAVTDRAGQPLALFNAAGSLLAELGAGTIGVANADVAYAPGGDLYVTDAASDRILRFGEPSPDPGGADPASAGGGNRAAPGLRILGRRLTLNRRGLLRARLRCPASERSGPCAGVMKLRPRRNIAGRRPLLAKGRFRINAGATKLLRLEATRQGRRLLRGDPRARRVQAFARVADAAGNRRFVSKRMTVRVRR